MWATTYLLVYLILLINLYYFCLAAPVIMCYFHSTARERTNIAKFEIKDINFTLCTHYIYHYAIIDSTTYKLVARDPSVEEGPSGLYREFTNAKMKFPSIKTLLFVGRPAQHHECARIGIDNTLLNEFVTSAVVLLRQYGFDGLNVQCTSTSDKISLANILKGLREKFNETATNDKLILTLSALGMELYIRPGYDVVSIAKTVDYVIIETHQLYFDAMQYAHFATPLYPIQSKHPYSELGMNVSLNAWNSLGMPYEKMVVAFTGVGRWLELVNQSNYEPGAPVTRSPYRGSLYNIINGLAYPEICDVRPNAQRYFDDVQKTPYLVQDQLWVGYDDTVSLQMKIKWAKQFDVAGFIFSGLDEDDFTGTSSQTPCIELRALFSKPRFHFTFNFGVIREMSPAKKCGEGQYPLLAAIRNATIEAWPSVNQVSPKFDNKKTTTMSPADIERHDGADTDIVQYLPYGLLLIPLLLIAIVVIFFLWRRNKPRQME